MLSSKFPKLKEFLISNHWKNKPRFSTPLTSYTSFRCSSVAHYLLKVADIQELKKALAFCGIHKIPYFILGKGSNSIFSDKGFYGLLILLGEGFKKITKKTNSQLVAGAGVSTTGLAQHLKKSKLGGGEFLIGIPASVGGLVFMNAGANGKETKQILKQVHSIDFQGNAKIRTCEKINFAYRYSDFIKNKETITEVVFQFQPSSSEQIEKLQSKMLKKRKASQPIHQSTWGSVFKNPNGAYAADLIEKCGLKGKTFGKLEVSQKHSNFFVNLGGASFKDIETAFLTIQKTVWKKFEIFLVPEVRIIDPYGEIIQKYYSRYF